MERKMFAVKRDIGQQFFERCKKKSLVVSRVLENFMKLFVAGKMDEVASLEAKEEDGQKDT